MRRTDRPIVKPVLPKTLKNEATFNWEGITVQPFATLKTEVSNLLVDLKNITDGFEISKGHTPTNTTWCSQEINTIGNKKETMLDGLKRVRQLIEDADALMEALLHKDQAIVAESIEQYLDQQLNTYDLKDLPPLHQKYNTLRENHVSEEVSDPLSACNPKNPRW